MSRTGTPPRRGPASRPTSTGASATRLDPAVYRRRRLVVLAGVVIVIALLVVLVRIGLSLTAAGVDASDQAKETASANPTTTLAGCDARSLTATASPDGTVIKPGWKVSVSAKIAAASSRTPCLADGSPTVLGLRVLHGDTVVYDSTLCEEESSKKLLFGEDFTWTTGFVWDGHTHAGTEESCAPRDPVEPGVYSLQLIYKGKPVGSPTSVTVEGAAPADSASPSQEPHD